MQLTGRLPSTGETGEPESATFSPAPPSCPDRNVSMLQPYGKIHQIESRYNVDAKYRFRIV